MDEARTRRELIDPRLAPAGWDPQDPSLVLQELELRLRGVETQDLAHPPEARGFTDYALVRHGVPVAVVEPKKTSKNVEIGRQQALGYSEALAALHGSPQPLVFYTNGHRTHFWEVGVYPPEVVYGYPTPTNWRLNLGLIKRLRLRLPPIA